MMEGKVEQQMEWLRSRKWSTRTGRPGVYTCGVAMRRLISDDGGLYACHDN